LFDAGRWVRPSRATSIELVPVNAVTNTDGTPNTPVAWIYEMGIPVCPAEWTQPYHINVLQRVPMNPCRDAVASGYLTRLHRACLPVLLPQMNDEQVRQDWVGNAVPHCEQTVQQEVIRRGFGENLARSVPKMGVRQYDEDAREIGVEVIDTRQTSGGFRQILQQHLPTTKEAVDGRNRELRAAAAAGSFDPEAVLAAKDQDRVTTLRRSLIEAAGGRERVGQVLEFARWFCQRLLDGYGETAICSVRLAELRAVDAVATWSSGDELTLGIDTLWLWSEPLGEQSLGVYCHECSHHLNAHHGRDFHKEVERLAGRAAAVMLMEGESVRRRFPKFFKASLVNSA
jgi:hypothetical protein